MKKSEFNKLSNMEKRVFICQDVLARLKTGRIKAEHDTILGTLGDIPSNNESAQKYINKYKCEACAKGSLLCSWVGNFNKVTTCEISDLSTDVNKTFPKELVKIFGADFMHLLEYLFEGDFHEVVSGDANFLDEYGNVDGVWYEYKDALQDKSPRVILSTIMRNIVKNGGVLKYKGHVAG